MVESCWIVVRSSQEGDLIPNLNMKKESVALSFIEEISSN